jgi:4'-phosphopantetheinyl transferase EntD
MPLPVRVRDVSLAGPSILTLCELDALEETLRMHEAAKICSIFLSPAEQEIYQGFSYDKRRLEWLGGRLACKAALLELLGDAAPAPAALAILPSVNGAPNLQASLPGTLLPPAISISHSTNFAAAAASRAVSCGIDIQEITGRTERVRKRFATTAELALLRSCTRELTEPQRLSLLWSAKEAVKKSVLKDHPGFVRDIVLQSFAGDDGFTLAFSCPRPQGTASVTAVLLEGYALAFTAAGDNHA